MLPTVADVLALDAVRRGAPRVLAAPDRLDAPVRWVHVIELAQAGHLLRGGELVLSTGIALPPDPEGLGRYVAGLASAGVSALAVELGSRYVRELPRALVGAAAAHRLPLIVLERETQFIAVTEAVHAQILDASVAELRAAERLHRVFTGLAVAGASMQEVVAQASAIAGAPVILEDLAHRVLACAPAGQEVTALLTGFAARSRGVRISGRSGYDPASGWLVAMVGAGGSGRVPAGASAGSGACAGDSAGAGAGDWPGDWARLIFALAGQPGPADQVLAERAAATLDLARLVRDQREESPERTAHRWVLGALLGSGYADPADLHARITALGVPLAGHRLLPVVIRLSERDQPSAQDRLTARDRAPAVAGAVAESCLAIGVPAISGPLDAGRIGALLALPPGADPDEVLARLCRSLRPALGAADVIGAGPLVSTLEQAPSAFSDAADAAGAAAWGGEVRPFVRLADLRLAGLLYQLRDDPRVVSYAERELGPLLLHDESAGTDLAGILAIYLHCGANKAEAAHRAGLARPTMYERLRQIEQVLGTSLDSADSRLALHAALLALRASRCGGTCGPQAARRRR